MTFEEMERTMEFILNQQAKFSVDIELLKESIVEMKTQADLDRAAMREGIEAMLQIAERMEKTTSNLVIAQVGLSQRVARIEDRVDHLEES